MISRQDLHEALQAVMVSVRTEHDTATKFASLGICFDDFCNVLADFHEGIEDADYRDEHVSMVGFIHGFLTGLACGRREDYSDLHE
jgi:hypothetical protein